MCYSRLIAVLLLWLVSTPAAFPAGVATRVAVSIPPQRYLVERVGGELVEVTVMVPPGASPHSYEPKPTQMAALARAAAYFAVGVEFEGAWLPRMGAANPGLLVVHTDEGIKKLSMTDDRHHGDQGEEANSRGKRRQQEHGRGQHRDGDEHAGLDPHVWLSPRLVALQAQRIAAGLARVDPKNAGRYEANLKAFRGEIEALDRELHGVFAALEGHREFMVFHPTWGYLARDYGLRQVPVQMEGKEPSARELVGLIAHAREKGIKTIFVQPQFSARTAEVLGGEIGGRVVFADPMAEDWMANLRGVARQLKKALR